MKRIWLKEGPASGAQVIPSMEAFERGQVIVDEEGQELDPREVEHGLVYVKPKRGSQNHWVFWKQVELW